MLDYRGMKRVFTSFLVATAGCSPVPDVNATRGSETAFSQSYGLGVSVDAGRCIYWLTDTGMDAAQLTAALGDYKVERGIEILTSGDTPEQCVIEAKAAVTKAGFVHVRSRPGTDKDRLAGIP